MSSANIHIDLEGDALAIIRDLQSQLSVLNTKVDGLETNARESFKGISQSIKQVSLVSITQGFREFREQLTEFNAPGLSFESQMADLSAITGITGGELQDLGDKARKNAGVFGGDASKSVETYKLLLSQLSPELAKFPKVLSAMADSSTILSKTMKNDQTAAVEVLTTAMNQYGVTMDDPIKAQKELSRYMNAMAAGAKEGSAELPALRSAIQNVGGDAKSSGLSFETMVSSIEALDKAGKKGAEGGVALRNTLATLNQGRFLPKDLQKELVKLGVDINFISDKTIPFTDRLRALTPTLDDAAILAKLFGRENKLAGEALIRSVDAQDKMTKAITGTNTAHEQAKVIMATRAEGMSRFKATITDLKISISEVTGSFLPMTEMTFVALQSLSSIIPAINGISQAVNFLRVAQNRLLIVEKIKAVWTSILTAKQWLLNIALNANPIGLVVLGITALIAVVTAIIVKYDEWGAALSLILGPLGFVINLIQSFRRHWDSIKKAFADGGIIGGLKRIGVVILDALLMPVQQLLELLSKIPVIGDIAGAGVDKIKNIRANLELTTPDENASKTDLKNTTNTLPFNTPISPTAPSVINSNEVSNKIISSNKTTEVKPQIGALVKDLTINVNKTSDSEGKIKDMVLKYMREALNEHKTVY